MSLVDESELPVDLSPFEAVEAAYPAELTACTESLARRLPVLVECDKELVPYFYKCLRDQLKARNLQCTYLDGRPRNDEEASRPLSLTALMIAQLRDAVRGPVGERVVVLPHLDLLTTNSGGLTSEAREVIPLLYENPSILWLGFKDVSFPLPEVIGRLFPRHVTLIGIARHRLARLVTQREARKLGRGLDVYALYKYVSGVNAVRLRRILDSLEGQDSPADPKPVHEQVRQFTLGNELSVPNVDLKEDVGGYATVKERLEREILDVLHHKDELDDEDRIKAVEGLIPRGMIFWGPPGTGKTLLAKAMATSLGAAVLVVSGPELKSKWVGESEEKLRQLFLQARQSAPAVIVFDEIDSFASARGTYTGSGVEHSMVNQLLTEMDGFRSDELVFVVGTTNFVESLDPALLRPGRFEFQLHIPYPDADDRRAILQIHDAKLGLEMSERALDHAVKITGGIVEGAASTRYSGDHLQALCRQIARRRLREQRRGPTEPADVDWALEAYLERPKLTKSEEAVVATHEAGHAICALFCEHAPRIERISIRGDLGALGYVSYADPAHRYVTTRNQLLDNICVLFGGREAERMALGDMSAGSAHDLQRATAVARTLVEELGMGDLPTRRYDEAVADATRAAIDAAVDAILAGQEQRARALVDEHRDALFALRDALIEKKVLDATALPELGIEREESNG